MSKLSGNDRENEIFQKLSDFPATHEFWKNKFMFTRSVFMQESMQMRDPGAFWRHFDGLPTDLKRFIRVGSAKICK